MSDHRFEPHQMWQSLPSLGAIFLYLSGKDVHWWAAFAGLVFIVVQLLYVLWKWRRDVRQDRQDQSRARAKKREPAGRVRVAAAVLTLSAAGLVALLGREGYTDTATVPVQGDVPTVGFGSTTREDGSRVQLGDTTTPVRAIKRTLAYTQTAEADFKRCVHAPLTQGEFDLYLDFGYQYGMPTLCASRIVARLNEQRYREACTELLEYRFMTSTVPRSGWAVSRRNAAGEPVRWQFDCSTPGNKVCRGVWTRQVDRHSKCVAEQE